MIIRGGENIYPKEIENILLQHPQINDAQVVGVPDEYFGEVAAACIKKNKDESLTEDEIIQYCKSKMSHQKVPKYIFFTDEFPLTASGKVIKMALKKQVIEELGI
ncbi:AMP-binding enzyme [Neobacillus dielmonensis]|uniref:AMP-binding enzyme n=1 Tax=Neobacillus dielmonensis TaxID=1347369 RepID=UPI001F3E4EE8|nr:hypothetical protein [Neobacillus dielmonensis]